jgi:hypothetical protein
MGLTSQLHMDVMNSSDIKLACAVWNRSAPERPVTIVSQNLMDPVAEQRISPGSREGPYATREETGNRRFPAEPDDGAGKI